MLVPNTSGEKHEFYVDPFFIETLSFIFAELKFDVIYLQALVTICCQLFRFLSHYCIICVNHSCLERHKTNYVIMDATQASPRFLPQVRRKTESALNSDGEKEW
jgi:hypothetical protein